MTYRFLCPQPDGSLIDIAIEANTLNKAFDIFADDHWHPDMDGTYAVFCGQRLTARVMPCRNAETGEVTPMDQEFDPPRQQSLACGD